LGALLLPFGSLGSPISPPSRMWASCSLGIRSSCSPDI
jgi:hypothetical protein